jgi:hypothetical protein
MVPVHAKLQYQASPLFPLSSHCSHVSIMPSQQTAGISFHPLSVRKHPDISVISTLLASYGVSHPVLLNA